MSLTPSTIKRKGMYDDLTLMPYLIRVNKPNFKPYRQPLCIIEHNFIFKQEFMGIR
jgi:hypothetical protein